MGFVIAGLGIVVCMMTCSMFLGHAPRRERTLAVTSAGVVASIALWILVDIGLGLDNDLVMTMALSLLLVVLTMAVLSTGLRRRVVARP